MKIRVVGWQRQNLAHWNVITRGPVTVVPLLPIGKTYIPRRRGNMPVPSSSMRRESAGETHLILQSWFVVVPFYSRYSYSESTLSIVYLFVFNRKTRQSLHDLIVGSYVVKAEREGMAPAVRCHVAGPLRCGHCNRARRDCGSYFFTGHYLLVLDNLSFISLLPLQKALASEPGIQYATVAIGTKWPISSEKGKQSQSYTSVRVTTSGQNADLDSVANRLARITLNSYPNAAAQDLVEVSISYGYDIGIASAWQRRNYAFSPTQWRQRLEPKPKP